MTSWRSSLAASSSCAKWLIVCLSLGFGACVPSGDLEWISFPGSKLEVGGSVSDSLSSKISETSELTQFSLNGTCTLPGQNLVLTTPKDLSRTVPCKKDGTWEVNLDLSNQPDGEILFSFEIERAVDSKKASFTKSFVKLTGNPTPHLSLSGAGSMSLSTLSSGYSISWVDPTDNLGNPLENQEVCAGTSAGSCDLGLWRELSPSEISQRSISVADFGILTGTSVYLNLRATDRVGHVTETATYGPIQVDWIPPTSPYFALLYPIQSPGNYSTPFLSFTGLTPGETVQIYSSSSCDPSAWVGDFIPSNSAENISLSIPLAEGSYHLHTLVMDSAGNSSGCSSVGIAYELDQTAPGVTSFGVTNVSPTNDRLFGLNLGSLIGSYQSYCILENTSLVSGCGWVSGTVPASFTVSAAYESKTLTLYLRDEAGNVSSAIQSNAVTLAPAYPAPTAPTGLTATQGDASMSLSWTPPVGSFGPLTYRLYRGLSGGSTMQLVASEITGTQLTDTGLVNGVTYEYLVHAVGEGGISPWSSAVSAFPYSPVLTVLSLSLASGYSSTLQNSGTATTRLEVTASDQYGREMSGVSVSLSLPANGGSTALSTQISNATGQVFYDVTSSLVAGDYSVTATSGGITTSALVLTYTPCTGAGLTNLPFASGAGTVGSPYVICTPAQWNSIGSSSTHAGTYFQLWSDLDLSGGITMIGSTALPFAGNINGRGKTLQNIALTGAADKVGLISVAGAGASVSNLNLSVNSINAGAYWYVGGLIGISTGAVTLSGVTVTANGTLTGGRSLGALAGQLASGSTVSGCSAGGAGMILGTAAYTGGLIGYSGATITSSSSSLLVRSSSAQTGGLVGWQSGNITSSFSTGTLEATGASSGETGGLIGMLSSGTISNSYATGSVTASGASSSATGGLIGYQWGGTVSGCRSTGNVTASGPSAIYTGGLIGYQAGATTTTASYSTGIVTGKSHVGGVVGRLGAGVLSGCYSTGAVTGTTNVGGLVGWMESGSLQSAYARGTVTVNLGGTAAGGAIGLQGGGAVTGIYSAGTLSYTAPVPVSAGGLVGSKTAGTLVHSLWDTTTSGFTSSAAGTGYPTAVMSSPGTYAGMRWDFVSIWKMPATGSYPILQWQSEAGASISVGSLFAGGSGTAGSPYQIATSTQLQNLAYANQVNAAARSAQFLLTGDINLAGGISPIIGTPSATFNGVFDGGGYRISNYSITPTSDNAGLIGYASSFTIRNLTLEVSGISASSYSYVGGVLGNALGSGSLTNVHVILNGNVSGNSYVGGLGGYLNANPVTITNCSVTGVGSVVSVLGYSGGLVGQTRASITGSYSTVAVSSTGSIVGGLVGYQATGSISSSYATGSITVTGASSAKVGGLIGQNFSAGSVSQSYATGSVQASGLNATEVGGLIGTSNTSTLSQVYSMGSVQGATNVGGLIGLITAGSLSNAYAQGAVSANANAVAANSGNHIGGALGQVTGGTVTKIYSSGLVSGAPSNIGGLVGSFTTGTVSSSFWDVESSGQSTSAGGPGFEQGLGTAQLQGSAPYVTQSWDFSTPVWRIPMSGGYPIFNWQP